MSPEERELLEKSVALAQENNNILLSMRRSMRLARVMTLIYWLFIIGSAVGAFYLLQPYLNDLQNVYSGAGDLINNFKELSQ
ncbi:hypothetical protein HYW73_03600 [Candidatus Nomurabacteria bacterium]|nr:hypothetical protein [Candidatus Nomurabacteria bacterium]